MDSADLPPLSEIGPDLLRVPWPRRLFSLLLPFVCIAGYGVFAFQGWWAPAVLCLIALSFVTYGSSAHDLVHRTLGLHLLLNEGLLTLIEGTAFRSGHAYRQAHLHHHARFPHDDDIEGRAAGMSFPRSLLEGVIFQGRIIVWAVTRPNRDRVLVILETAGVVALLGLCLATIPITPVPAVYAVLMIAGSWIIPLITSYVPHNPAAGTDLTRTRLFRGRLFSILALEHLYHLEHHLYPMVPHHHWPALA